MKFFMGHKEVIFNFVNANTASGREQTKNQREAAKNSNNKSSNNSNDFYAAK